MDLNRDDVSPITGFADRKEIYLPNTALRADLIVSLAKMKTHHWAGATLSMKNYFGLVHTNATMQGFLVHHYVEHHPMAMQRLTAWVKDGAIRQKEDIVEGFENAPRALMRLFSGANVGKQLLKL